MTLHNDMGSIYMKLSIDVRRRTTMRTTHGRREPIAHLLNTCIAPTLQEKPVLTEETSLSQGRDVVQSRLPRSKRHREVSETGLEGLYACMHTEGAGTVSTTHASHVSGQPS